MSQNRIIRTIFLFIRFVFRRSRHWILYLIVLFLGSSHCRYRWIMDSVFCVFVMDRDGLSVYTVDMPWMEIQIESRTLNNDIAAIKSTPKILVHRKCSSSTRGWCLRTTHLHCVFLSDHHFVPVDHGIVSSLLQRCQSSVHRLSSPSPTDSAMYWMNGALSICHVLPPYYTIKVGISDPITFHPTNCPMTVSLCSVLSI